MHRMLHVYIWKAVTTSANGIHRSLPVCLNKKTSIKDRKHQPRYTRMIYVACVSAERHMRQATIGRINKGLCALGKRRSQQQATFGRRHWSWNSHIGCVVHIAQLTLGVDCPYRSRLMDIAQSLSTLNCLHRPWPSHHGKSMSGITYLHRLCPAHNCLPTSGVTVLHFLWLAHNIQRLSDVVFLHLLCLYTTVYET